MTCNQFIGRLIDQEFLLFTINNLVQIKMQKFQDLLTEAAQLKQQQLKQERKNFQALPEYLKSGLNYSKKYIQLRQQDYLVQQYICEKIKSDGNIEFKKQNYQVALTIYQQALSIFRFISAKKYENLKDEDIVYESYDRLPQKYTEQHNCLLVALYLNICSCLTKLNKKDQALHSAQQALKLKETAKAFYKKAQAYLQYINKDPSDIKLGFYYLNKAYQISKDESIVAEMHRVKHSIEAQRRKQKDWFKFMFDKNKKDQSPDSQNIKALLPQDKVTVSTNQPKPNNPIKGASQDFFEQARLASGREKDQGNADPKAGSLTFKKQFQEQLKLAQIQQDRRDSQNLKTSNCQQRTEKTKQQLKKYLQIPEQNWLIQYQEDFIHKHGSKIYSVLQLYNYSEYLPQFKALLAKCLQLRQKTHKSSFDDKRQIYKKWVEWLKMHPVQKYHKYIDRYDSQVAWIQSHRNKQTIECVAGNQTKQIVGQKKLIKETSGPKRLQHNTNRNRNAERQSQQDQVEQSVPKMVEEFLENNASIPVQQSQSHPDKYQESVSSERQDIKQQQLNQNLHENNELKATVSQGGLQYLKLFLLTVGIMVIMRLAF